MKSHFNFKSLAFYGVAIGSVLVLFKFVTAYGEANLKAPALIDGRYRLSYTQDLPNCPKSNDLVLVIQQSGSYLHGALSSTKTSAPPKPSLNGLLNNQQLDLSGKVARAVICPDTANRSQENSADEVKIQSRVEGKNLEGKITLNSSSEAIEFTAQKQAPAQSEENPSH